MRRVIVIVIAALGMVRPAIADAGALAVAEAWARATPPGANTGAAYLEIRNAGPAERLVEATTPAARETQIHTIEERDGMMVMRPLEELAIPAGDTLRLEPGGTHLMLIGLAAPLVPGESIALTLRFAGSDPLTVRVPIRDARTGIR